jgi:hypothetical protein
MNKPLGIALLVIGILLLVFGFNESQSTASEVSKFFNNSPTDRAIWFLVGGGVATAVGLYLSLTKSR